MAPAGTDDPTEWMQMAATETTRTGVAGFDLTRWEADTWILHAMYEYLRDSSGVTFDDARKQAIESGQAEPLIVNSFNVDQGATATGIPLGRSDSPGPDWRRLRWLDLATRVSAPLGSSGVPPCSRWFPYKSWPVRIRPPAEGSLDRESFVRLIELLATQPGSSVETPVTCFFAPLATSEHHFDSPLVLIRRLAELEELYDWEGAYGSPSNIWPQDKSWFIYTDWDLCGTKVSGSVELIASLTADSQLETILYP